MSTRTTKRPLNKCKDCGHTWYPKGRSVSLRCPNCRSTSTKKAGLGVGASILIVIGLAIAGKKEGTQTAPADQAVVASQVQETNAVPSPSYSGASSVSAIPAGSEAQSAVPRNGAASDTASAEQADEAESEPSTARVAPPDGQSSADDSDVPGTPASDAAVRSYDHH